MSEQLLSTDPAAGLLSTDPGAGAFAPRVMVEGQPMAFDAYNETQQEAPPEGVWVHPRGERLAQSAVSVDPALAQRLEREKGWQWQPPDTSEGPGRAIATGVPVIGALNPEDVLLGYGAAKGVIGAVKGTVGATQRALAGAGAVGGMATTAAKYVAAKTVLTKMGVPEPIAEVLAVGASGYRRGAKATTPAAAPAPVPEPVPVNGRSGPAAVRTGTAWTSAGPMPAPVSAPAPAAPVAAAPVAAPVASAPVAPAPAAAPAALPVEPRSPAGPSLSPQGWSPARVRNEVGLAARRAKVTLSPAEYEQAYARVTAGEPPTAAVTAVAPPPAPAKLKLTAAEMGTYTQLRKLGKTHQEAAALMQVQRELAARLGTPTGETVRQTLAERNTTGRWPGTPPRK